MTKKQLNYYWTKKNNLILNIEKDKKELEETKKIILEELKTNKIWTSNRNIKPHKLN